MSADGRNNKPMKRSSGAMRNDRENRLRARERLRMKVKPDGMAYESISLENLPVPSLAEVTAAFDALIARVGPERRRMLLEAKAQTIAKERW